MSNKLPNGPSSPSWWQLVRWIKDPLTYQRECHQRYGDIFTLTMKGFPPLVIVGNAVGVEEILSLDGRNFDVGRGNTLAKPLVGENSLFLYDGERHRRERKLLMPSFHGKSLSFYAQSIIEISHQVASRWRKGQKLIVRQEMQQISLEVILKVVFGVSQGERYQTLQPLLANLLDISDSPLRSSFLFLQFLQKDWGKWSPWGRMQHCKRQINQLLEEEIEERRSQTAQMGEDVLSLMMSAQDEKGESLTDAELRDELLTLLFAGHETTATMLAWAFYEILRQPSIEQKLRAEIGLKGKGLKALDIAQLPYLTAVCQEVLRKYPVIPIIFPRISKSPLKIMGYELEAETWLTPSMYLVHYCEDLYPEPETFRPERFQEKQFSPYEYFPFGGGNRRCLGYALAELEMKLVLFSILSKYKLVLAKEDPIKPQRRGFTLSPLGGVPIIYQEELSSDQ